MKEALKMIIAVLLMLIVFGLALFMAFLEFAALWKYVFGTP